MKFWLSRSLTLIFISIALFWASLLYVFLVTIIPFVYINAFVTFGFAVLVTLLAYLGCYFGLFYTKRQRLWFVLSLVILAEVVQWLGFLAFMLVDKTATFNLAVIFQIAFYPTDNVFPVLAEMYRLGTYEVFGIPIKGVTTLIVWILEMVIIALVPIKYISSVSFPPFSTFSKQWFPKYTLTDYWNLVPSRQELCDAFSKGNTNILTEVGKGYSNKYTRIDIYYHAQSQIAYISATNYRVSKHTGKAHPHLIIDKHLVESFYAKAMLDQHKNNKKLIALNF